MGITERFRNLGRSTSDLHREHLRSTLAQVGGVSSIDAAPDRQRTTIVGQVARSVVVPRPDGGSYLEVVIDDGSAKAELRFLGRTRLPGIELGRTVRVSGRGHRSARSGRLRFTNPVYELL